MMFITTPILHSILTTSFSPFKHSPHFLALMPLLMMSLVPNSLYSPLSIPILYTTNLLSLLLLPLFLCRHRKTLFPFSVNHLSMLSRHNHGINFVSPSISNRMTTTMIIIIIIIVLFQTRRDHSFHSLNSY